MVDAKGVFGGRVGYLILAVVTIAAGLTVFLAGGALPPAVRDMLGDALWAMMVVWWLSAAAPRWPVYRRGLAALAICVAVELSQRYHTPWLDALRRTLPGHLVLGSGYDPRDFLAYAAGVVAAMSSISNARLSWNRTPSAAEPGRPSESRTIR